ncbi:MAG: phosphate ABC transporter permease [Chloroflexi bacterium RBG_19FT_COMBO_50_10]|nr:MAG: phosphate ABC transporter permease [Chloroflexi bacterium RBG_19FT_COMBO_50_10]
MATDQLTKSHQDVVILHPTHGLAALNLRDLWVYRELVLFLAWRDVLVRYKQTVLGAAWAVIQPIVQMVVFTFIFSKAAGLSSEGVPYPIFNYTALLPWGLFSKAMNDAGRSLVNNRNMITKIYFPRLTIPVASVLAGLVDFGIAFLVYIVIILFYTLSPGSTFTFHLSPALLTLPLFIILALVAALGVSLWFSAANVLYRDVGHILPFLTQIWFFVTPIVYSSSEVSTQWQIVYALNPLTGVVEGFRWSLLGIHSLPWQMLAISAGVAVVILISGLIYFRNMERTFADEI